MGYNTLRVLCDLLLRLRGDWGALDSLGLLFGRGRGEGEYQKNLKALKSKLGSGRNWHLLKQRFSAGILALVPVDGNYNIQNYEYVLIYCV